MPYFKDEQEVYEHLGALFTGLNADAELGPGAIFRIGTTSIRIEAANAPTRVPISARDHFGGEGGAGFDMQPQHVGGDIRA